MIIFLLSISLSQDVSVSHRWLTFFYDLVDHELDRSHPLNCSPRPTSDLLEPWPHLVSLSIRGEKIWLSNSSKLATLLRFRPRWEKSRTHDSLLLIKLEWKSFSRPEAVQLFHQILINRNSPDETHQWMTEMTRSSSQTIQTSLLSTSFYSVRRLFMRAEKQRRRLNFATVSHRNGLAFAGLSQT